jgi:hypothetical protein
MSNLNDVSDEISDLIMSQTVLLCTISNDCMAPYWGPRGAYVMSYQANAILKHKFMEHIIHHILIKYFLILNK